jgi:hypothetical protein
MDEYVSAARARAAAARKTYERIAESIEGTHRRDASDPPSETTTFSECARAWEDAALEWTMASALHGVGNPEAAAPHVAQAQAFEESALLCEEIVKATGKMSPSAP